MKNMIAIAIVSFQLVTSVAYAWEQQPHKPAPAERQQQGQFQGQGQAQAQGQGQGQSQQALSGAAARASSNADTDVKTNTVVGVTTGSTTVKTGPTSATGGTATGGSSSLTGSGNGGGATLGDTGNGNGAHVSTENHLMYLDLPTIPAVAPTVTGTGGIAVTSQCGPLKEVFQKPIQYLLVGYFGTKTITIDGQFTDVLGPVIGEDGKVKEFDMVNNRDGTVSEWGTIYTEAAIIISSSVSKQFAIGGFGTSGGGVGSNGVAGTITGTERIIALGRCEYRRFQLVPTSTVVNSLKK